MKILFIGFGSIARKHFLAFSSLDQNIIFYALRSSKIFEEIEGVVSLSSWQNVPADIAFAIISNPTSLHLEALADCVERDIPVMIEKPVAESIVGLEEIITKIRERSIPNYVACNLRFLPVLQFLKDRIAGGELSVNEVNVYCGSDLRKWRPGKEYKNSYSANESQGGGVHLDLFHELDYLVWIFGIPMSWKGVRRSVSSLEISAADYAHYNLFYENFSATMTLNYYRRDAKRQIEILFDDETWTVNLLKGTVTTSGNNIIFDSGSSGINETYETQAKHVLEMLSGNVESINPIFQSIEILKICLSGEKIS